MWEREEAGKSCFVVIIHTLTHDKFCELFEVSFRFEVIAATFPQILVFVTYVVYSDSVDNGCERFWTEQAQAKDHLLSSNQVFVSPTRHFANSFSTVSVHTDPYGVANSGKSDVCATQCTVNTVAGPCSILFVSAPITLWFSEQWKECICATQCTVNTVAGPCSILFVSGPIRTDYSA